MSERKPISARNGAKTQRQGDHQRDQPGRHAELDDHHAVERAVQQHHRHADRDLEQRQPQQPAAAAAPASPRRRTAGTAVPSRVQPRASVSLSRLMRADQLQRLGGVEAAGDRARSAPMPPAVAGRARRQPAAQRRFADRLDRGRAVAAREQPADRVHQRQRRGARREGEERRTVGARGEAGQRAHHVAGARSGSG